MTPITPPPTPATDEEIRNLVIERLRSLSPDKKISIGSSGEFTKDELIKKIKAQDEIGKKIVEIQMAYLRSLKLGILLENNGS